MYLTTYFCASILMITFRHKLNNNIIDILHLMNIIVVWLYIINLHK
jgi:hypothetical protein